MDTYSEVGTFDVNVFQDIIEDKTKWESYPNGSPAYTMYYKKIKDLYDVQRILKKYYQIDRIKWAKAHKLRPEQEILPHSDPVDGNENVHVIHLVLTTNDAVQFNLDGKDREFKPGHIYEIDNTKPHFVKNLGETDRIHIMAILYGHPIN